MPQQTLKKLLEVLDKSVVDFTDSLPIENKRIFNKVIELVKQLEVKDGNVKNNVTNIKLLSRISRELDSIILSDSYLKKVAEFSKVFDTVAELNNKYLSATFAEFKPKKVLDEIREFNKAITIEKLTEAGVGLGMKTRILDVLNVNIAGGGSYGDLIRVLNGETNVPTNGTSPYFISESQKIVIDAVHQYNALYIQSVTEDLGLAWFQYLGSIIKTSREFCIHMTEKRYFHISEVPTLLTGNIDGVQIGVSKKTGLPLGMFDNENSSNFFVYRGGHKCGHQIIPVSSVVVPKELRDRFG